MLSLLLGLSLCACGGGERASEAKSAGKADVTADLHESRQGQGDKAAHAEEESGYIQLTAEQLKQSAIAVAQAGPAEIREALPLYGVIAPNAERVREITPRYTGVIRSVGKRIGDAVRQGEPLAVVESNESLENYTITAPLAGVIIARNANPGEQAGDKALFTVADLSSVWVEVSVFPRDVAKVRVGQSVRVKSADRALSAEGEVIYVAPFGSSTNQTVTARVLLDNAERKWPPGLYVTADVTLAKTQVPVAVRQIALQTLEDRNVVFVQREKGFAPQVIQTGRGDGEFAEVLSGLQGGERYATTNSFILKAELGKGEAEHEH